MKRVYFGWIEKECIKTPFNWTDDDNDSELRTSGDGIFRYKAKCVADANTEIKIKITVET